MCLEMNNKNVKHMIAEQYSAFVNDRKAVYRKELPRHRAIVTCNLDLWTSKVSGLKYIGE